SDNADKLHAVVEFLLDKESMTGEQFEAIMRGEEAGEASATAMFDSFSDEKQEESDAQKNEENAQ
ncbi:MAG: hypothetical protein J6V25_04595, partial [Oscillospiraceae bacterium]|nr:hypothetical protein [Oscillospiraceae bacterium]